MSDSEYAEYRPVIISADRTHYPLDYQFSGNRQPSIEPIVTEDSVSIAVDHHDDHLEPLNLPTVDSETDPGPFPEITDAHRTLILHRATPQELIEAHNNFITKMLILNNQVLQGQAALTNKAYFLAQANMNLREGYRSILDQLEDLCGSAEPVLLANSHPGPPIPNSDRIVNPWLGTYPADVPEDHQHPIAQFVAVSLYLASHFTLGSLSSIISSPPPTHPYPGHSGQAHCGTAMSDSSASESEKEQGVQIPRIFSVPNQNAGVPEFREALKTAHKLVHELADENKALRAQIAKYKASDPGRKGRKQRSTIIDYCFGQGVWSDGGPLGSKHGLLPEDSAAVGHASRYFKPDSALYPQYLTAALYAHIDKKFHDLIDTSAYPDFARNFIRQLNAQRSSGINNTKECLPMILLEEGTVLDLKSATIQCLLLHPGDDPQAKKCSSFPPILYDKLGQSVTNLFMNRVPALVLRGILWGKDSLKNQGTQRPLSSVVGYKWNILKTIFLLYWLTQKSKPGKPENFEEIGTISQISFRQIFMRFLRALKMMGAPGLRRVIKFWHSVVFASITVAAPVERVENAAGADSDDEMAEALAGLDIEGILNHDANPLSIVNWD
ncbi:hypothetical protein B0H17DRAFT_1259983, partial [Mycena rosella]